MKKSIVICAFILIAAIVYLWNLEPKQTYPCAFCIEKIINKQKFYEDEHYVALINYAPIVKGHCLIIPKAHRENITDLSKQEQQDLVRFIEDVHVIVSKTFDVGPYLILQKNGREVGQTVPHVHFHYIPRKENEAKILPFIMKYVSWVFKPHYSDEKIKEVVSMLRENAGENPHVSMAG